MASTVRAVEVLDSLDRKVKDLKEAVQQLSLAAEQLSGDNGAKLKGNAQTQKGQTHPSTKP
jgi:hypothetical protein